MRQAGWLRFPALRSYYGLFRHCASPRYSYPCGSSTWASPLTSGRQLPAFRPRAWIRFTPPLCRTPSVKAGGRQVGPARVAYFFLPRIQKGRSPGPALARIWASSALNWITSVWRALAAAASALSWSTSRRSPASSPGNPAIVAFKEAASAATPLSPDTSARSVLRPASSSAKARLHLGVHFRRRLPPAGSGRRREIGHDGIQRVFLVNGIQRIFANGAAFGHVVQLPSWLMISSARAR